MEPPSSKVWEGVWLVEGSKEVAGVWGSGDTSCQAQHCLLNMVRTTGAGGGGAGEADLSHRFRGSRIWRSLSSAGGHMEMCRTFCIRMFAVKSEPIIDGTSGTCLFTSFFSFWLLLSGLQGCCAAADGGSRGMNAWLVRKASHSESRSARTLGSFTFFFFCVAALCEGNFTCKENEVCVRPNECRCRHGYFGASCDTSEHHFSSVFSKYFISILAINN